MGTLQHLIDLQLYLKFLSDNGNRHRMLNRSIVTATLLTTVVYVLYILVYSMLF